MSTDILEDDRRAATLSSDRTYRYRLRRTWDADKPPVAFIMLNPSTADETEDDPTVRRCIGYARDWGYGTLLVGNLFALRATDPDKLYEHPAPIGPENDRHLVEIANEAEVVVAAWGAHGGLADRGPDVANNISHAALTDIYALGTTAEGHPVHPLYQPKDVDLEVFFYG